MIVRGKKQSKVWYTKINIIVLGNKYANRSETNDIRDRLRTERLTMTLTP